MRPYVVSDHGLVVVWPAGVRGASGAALIFDKSSILPITKHTIASRIGPRLLRRRRCGNVWSLYDSFSHYMLIDDLRAARREKGWTQKLLADRIGVDPQMIMRLEQGIGAAKTLYAVMNALDFRLTGLWPGETLGEQLRNLRIKRSISMDALALRASLSRTTLASLERGGGSVAKLMQVLDILAPNAKRRAPERAYWGQGDKEDRDSRFTPPDFMAHIYDKSGTSDLDP